MDITRDTLTEQASATIQGMANKDRNAPARNGNQPKMLPPYYYVGQGEKKAVERWTAHLKRAGKGKAKPQDAGHRDLILWFLDAVDERFPDWSLDDDEPLHRKLEHVFVCLEVAELASEKEPLRLLGPEYLWQPDVPQSMPPVSAKVPPKKKPVVLCDTLALAASDNWSFLEGTK